MQRQYQNDIEIIIDKQNENIQPQHKIKIREQYVKMYEIDQYKIDKSLKFIAKLFEIMKMFATRSHAHLKVLVNLANNLIVSEDYVHLMDHTLHVKNRFKFSHNDFQDMGQKRASSNTQTQPNEDSQVEPLKQMMNKQKEEIQLLVKQIEQGEKEKKLLQDWFEKVLDKMKQKNDNNEDPNNKNIDIQNTVQIPELSKYQMERDLFNQTGNLYDRKRTFQDQRNFSQMYDNYEQGYFTERGQDPHKRYSSNRQSFNDYINLQKQLQEKELENEDLRNRLDDLEYDIKRAMDQQEHYKKKYQNQQESINNLENSKRQLDQLEDKISELKEKNNEYERKINQKDSKIRDIQNQLNQKSIQNPPQNNYKPTLNKQQSLRDKKLQKELDKIKGQLNNEKRKNKRLIKQIEKRSEYDIQKHLYEQQDVTDLLKCLFIQTQHIDDQILQDQQYEEQLQTLENNNNYEDENQNEDSDPYEDEYSDDNEDQNQQDSKYFDEQEQEQQSDENYQQSQESVKNLQNQQKPSIKVIEPLDSNYYKSDFKNPEVVQGVAKEISNEEDEEMLFNEHIDPDTIVKRIQTDEDEPQQKD